MREVTKEERKILEDGRYICILPPELTEKDWEQYKDKLQAAFDKKFNK